MIIGVDLQRDFTELQRLGISHLSEDFITTDLVKRYLDCGFQIAESGTFAAGKWPNICTSWAQRLSTNDKRSLVYFIATRS